MKLYGIKNCNSVKKAIDALNEKNINFEFFDIKKINAELLQTWLDKRKINDFINTSGMTARKISLTKDKVSQSSENDLKQCVLDHPSLIKRPVIVYKDMIFIAKEYENLLKQI